MHYFWSLDQFFPPGRPIPVLLLSKATKGALLQGACEVFDRGQLYEILTCGHDFYCLGPLNAGCVYAQCQTVSHNTAAQKHAFICLGINLCATWAVLSPRVLSLHPACFSVS